MSQKQPPEVFLQFSQYSQENTSVLIKLHTFRPPERTFFCEQWRNWVKNWAGTLSRFLGRGISVKSGKLGETKLI